MTPDRPSASSSAHVSRRASLSSTTSHPHAVNGGSPPPPHLSPANTSLAAGAAVNAGILSEERRASSGSLAGGAGGPAYRRRRSSVRHNFALNDPTMPAPGELAMSASARPHALQPLAYGQVGGTGSPVRHARTPSLGELHQELENEQEAQVVSPPEFSATATDLPAQNRLLAMIRQQEAQIQQLQAQEPQSASAIEDSNPPSGANSRAQTPGMTSVLPIRTGRPASQQRGSPALAAAAGEDHSLASSFHLPSPIFGGAAFRDESTFYQAERQTLMRENQMLKHRVRELERHLADCTGTASGHGPAMPSTLSTESHVEGDKPVD